MSTLQWDTTPHLWEWQKRKNAANLSASKGVECPEPIPCQYNAPAKWYSCSGDHLVVSHKAKYTFPIKPIWSHSWVFTLEKWRLTFTEKPFTNVYSSCIQNCPKLEIAQISFNGWMVQQTASSPHNEILLSSKKEQASDTTIWMNVKGIMLSQGSQLQKVTYCIIPFIWHF